MVRRRVSVSAIILLAALIYSVTGLAQPAPLKVVASFSILGDMTHEIGGEHIALTTIVGADGDAHSFEPAPKDVKALASARLLIVNGLSFEGWLPRLVKASGFKGSEVMASGGVVPRHLTAAEQALEAREGHGADTGNTDHPASIDPHAWQSLSNGVIYAKNIAAGLAKADPIHASDYQARASAYIERMKALDDEIKGMLAGVSGERRRVVTSHDAFGYFGQAYGVQFISAAGLSSEAEPSAKDIAGIIDQVRKEHVPAVFIENITSPKLVEQIARETGAKVGGTLYSDALAQPGKPAGTYLGMFKWNARQLIDALRPAALQ
ncbi:MAG: metal ABC transporter substrate-binding protein [Burkholderiaceae bacterium]